MDFDREYHQVGVAVEFNHDDTDHLPPFMVMASSPEEAIAVAFKLVKLLVEPGLGDGQSCAGAITVDGLTKTFTTWFGGELRLDA